MPDPDLEQQLAQLKQQAAQANTAQAKLEAKIEALQEQYEAAMETLNAEFGCSTIEAASALLAKNEAEIAAAVADLNKQMEGIVL